MDWLKLHTSYDGDERIVAAGEAAELLFLRGLAYAGRCETGGLIPAEMIPRICPTRWKPRVDALVRVGLWAPMPSGYRITNWDKWQQGGEELAARRRSDRERQARRRARARDEGADVSRDMSRDVTPPEQSRAEQSRKSSGSAVIHLSHRYAGASEIGGAGA